MGLQELSDNDRIFFLRNFTLSLLLHSADDIRIKQSIETEKFKMKYVDQKLEEEVNQPIVFDEKINQSNNQVLEPVNIKNESQSHLIRLHDKSQQKDFLELNKSGRFDQKNKLDGVSIIENMINDPLIEMIECPGQGRNVLIKIGEKVIVTKTNLLEKEIREIIHSFSIMSNIPIIGGVLRAIADSLYFSGIISSYVGSRFIINKKHSLLLSS